MKTRGIQALLALTLLSHGTSAGPLRLHPENPRYLEFRGKPAVFITSGEHYGAVLNLDFDYVAYLDEVAAHGFNHTRLFSGAYREIRELNAFDNVYFEICNEPYERGGMHPEWQARMISAIRKAEEPLANKHLISVNYAYGSAKISDAHPEVSLFNFHAAKPEAVVLNYDLGKAIGHNETGGSRRDDATYRIEGWEFILENETGQLGDS